ncbi:molecular chaperone GrpE [Reichenbachiella faecimaris]|uniref:Protein GrpE n=1 Tax=Reichenbachiella faecimaris TaxID=692418 RepID=A0A1W2GEX1_REIFA|nr:nucleotide exchange factor GrpE [Reichenbachiella faecimaris]SMD35197.1 molecular chaperone GrpE [Reichenbachiella faecimaris]
MAKNNKKADKKSEETVVEEPQVKNEETVEEKEEQKEEPQEELSAEEKLQAEVAESKDKYLRLYSEFENFRRRTSKEKLELINSASEGLIKALLPVLDDFERADQSMTEDADVKSVKEGVDLIYNKFKGILEQKGVKKIEADKGSEFDVEYHEAITQIPAPEEGLKGKVVDVIEKGYQLNDKVIRFAKVVTGA